jgi:membrane protease YdiL (CAAX protease family)
MLLIFTIFYLVYPFQIIKNQNYTSNFFADVISYSLGNSLEELLFRCFLLLAIVKQIGKIYGTLIVSLLFGVFHLQGLGLTPAGLSMVVTTFTMSLLLVSIIYFTNSIWPAIAFHITINLLLHTFLGFDNKNNGILHLEFISSDGIQNFATLVYEVVVCAFAILIYLRAGKKK